MFSNREAAMSVHFDRVRGRWIVRWRDNEHYGHLEISLVREAAARTVALIASSAA